MNRKSTIDVYIIIAASLLIVSALVWLLAPPDLLKPFWILTIYKIWIPTLALVIAVPISLLIGKGGSSDGILTRPMRWGCLIAILVAAVLRLRLGNPTLPSPIDPTDAKIVEAQKKLAGTVPGGVTLPPADFKGPVPAPFPPEIIDLKPDVGGTNPVVKQYANVLQQANEANKGDRKSENYVAKAAAAAAALYIMAEIPPPANALVAKVVGQLVMALFGDGDIDPGEAMFVGQLIQAAISGDPAQVESVFKNSDIGLKAIDKVSKELTNNQQIKDLLTKAGKDPATMVKVIQDQITKHGVNLDDAVSKIKSSIQGADVDQIVTLITKKLPARKVPEILNNLNDSVKLGTSIINATADDSIISDPSQRKEVLNVMVKRWLADPKVMMTNSPIPQLYQQATGVSLSAAQGGSQQ